MTKMLNNANKLTKTHQNITILQKCHPLYSRNNLCLLPTMQKTRKICWSSDIIMSTTAQPPTTTFQTENFHTS